MTTADFLSIARQYAGRPDDWPFAPRFDPVQRWYQRLAEAADHEVWLLSWLPGQHTDLHDHGGSAGAFALVTGELTETVLRGEETFKAGQGRSFGARHIHRIANNSTRPAVSVHVYAPALTTMTRYRIDNDRLLVAAIDRVGAQW